MRNLAFNHLRFYVLSPRKWCLYFGSFAQKAQASPAL